MINNDNFKLTEFKVSYTHSCANCGWSADNNTHYGDNGLKCPCGNWLCPTCASGKVSCGKCYY